MTHTQGLPSESSRPHQEIRAVRPDRSAPPGRDQKLPAVSLWGQQLRGERELPQNLCLQMGFSETA